MRDKGTARQLLEGAEEVATLAVERGTDPVVLPGAQLAAIIGVGKALLALEQAVRSVEEAIRESG